ncbi:DUF4062 domain-containing protein [Pseudomonas sp. BF-RE-26]|uniref:DUF4062 domain-containing protein n=1 Tax=Pseudomonas sp. BF-RE-26 TaxID=2832396 RepID=UPI001CBCD282|nr:DUF4062 domain-containing protein [Pseudomonas sp. BF-RE-26]
MKKKYQVFLGSTYEDLKNERQLILKLLSQNNFIPAGMENFPSSNREQLDFIKPIIDDSDIYILVIAGRYGSLSTDDISFTEEEYNYAVSQGKIILRFVHGEPGKITLENSETDAQKKDLLQKFKSKVMSSRLCNIWKDPHELSHQVVASLHQATTDDGILGWVRGNTELSPQGQMLLNEARRKNFELGSQVAQVREVSQRLESSVLALFSEAMKPATPSEYDAWEAGAIEQGHPTKLIDHIAHLGEKKIAHKDFVLPLVYGTRAPVIIIQPGVKVYKTDTGHATLLYMDEFRVEGVVAEQYSDRRVE